MAKAVVTRSKFLFIVEEKIDSRWLFVGESRAKKEDAKLDLSDLIEIAKHQGVKKIKQKFRVAKFVRVV